MGANDIILICITGLSAVNGIIIGVLAYRTIKDRVKDPILSFGVNTFFSSISSTKVQVGQTTKIEVSLMDKHPKEFFDSENKNCQPSFF